MKNTPFVGLQKERRTLIDSHVINAKDIIAEQKSEIGNAQNRALRGFSPESPLFFYQPALDKAPCFS
jgi:hypothetical protein